MENKIENMFYFRLLNYLYDNQFENKFNSSLDVIRDYIR